MCIVVPSGCVLPGDIKPIALGKRSSNHVGGSSPKKKCSSPINETDIKETLNHPKELTQSQRERARTNAFSNLIQASRIGDVNKIKEIAETHPEVINSLHIGYSALHYAVFYNHKAAVEALIEAGADIDNRNPGNGITPLAWGVDRNHCDLVGYLLECEADPSLANRDGITPLHTATKLKNYKMVETLLSINTETEEWTKVNARTNEGCTPAYFAAFDGSLDILALLYEYGGDFNISSNVNVSPLHRAVKRSQIESVKYIIENGGDINKQDENGRTCLHIAALAGNIEMLKLLLQFKPKMLFDNNNISPIDLARMRLLVAAEELLEEYSCTTWPIH